MGIRLQHFILSIHGVLARTGASTRALMCVNVWAPDVDGATEMATRLGRDQGFRSDGRWMVYDSLEAEQPAGELPSTYGLRFVEYEGDVPLASKKPPS